MIDFTKSGDDLIMRYTPEGDNEEWLVEPLQQDKDIPLSGRSLHVRREIHRPDIEDDDQVMDACYRFVVGHRENGYYRIDRRVLAIEYDLFLHESLSFKRTTFIAETNTSIFRAFNTYGLTQLYIGGDHQEAVPKAVFEEMLNQFPNTYELKKYAQARVSSMIRNYIPIKADFETKYTRYRARKASAMGSQPRQVFGEYELDKFSALVKKIEAMLGSAIGYTEAQWQEEILQILLLLYPKYIKAFKEAPVRDTLTGKDRKIDFLLVDATGCVDAIEIKKPFADCIVTTNLYRDNHVPMRELSGTIMQLEKYLYHLNRWGPTGEEKLNDRYKGQLPADLTIKIVNPTGMIIMGRDVALTRTQKMDFEVIRRKYRNVLDIMTYDDILRRLKTIQCQLKATIPVALSPAAPGKPEGVEHGPLS